MSTVLLGLCWPLQLPPTQKLVLISLADQANDEGACWPSVGSMVRRTCLSERAVRGALRGLEEVRLLQTHSRDGSSNWYTVTPRAYTPAADAPRQEMPPSPAPAAPDPGTSCPPPRHVVPPEPSINRQGTVKEPPAPPKRRREPVAKPQFAPPEWVPAAAWDNFVEMRRRIKKPLTDRAMELAVTRLADLKADGHAPDKVLDQSTLACWQGLFPIKKDHHHDRAPAGSDGRRESTAERVERINAEFDRREGLPR